MYLFFGRKGEWGKVGVGGWLFQGPIAERVEN